MKSKGNFMKKMVAILVSLLVVFGVSVAGAASLEVVYNDGGSTVTEAREHPSKALHFDVEYKGSAVVTAVLTLDCGDTVRWLGHGSENADLSDYLVGHWHWVYTPSGILTISDSHGEGQPPVSEPPCDEDVPVLPETGTSNVLSQLGVLLALAGLAIKKK